MDSQLFIHGGSRIGMASFALIVRRNRMTAIRAST